MSSYRRLETYLLIQKVRVAWDSGEMILYLNRSNIFLQVENQVIGARFLSTSATAMLPDFDALHSFVSIDLEDSEILAFNQSFRVMDYKVRRLLTLTEYSNWFRIVMADGTVQFDLWPTSREVRMFNGFGALMNPNNTAVTTATVRRASEMRDQYFKLLASKKKKQVHLEEMDRLTFISEYTTISAKNNITMAEMSVYLKNRHDLFSNAYLLAAGFQSVKTDMALSDVFIGCKYNKTPDVIINVSADEFLIIEFCVTNSDVALQITRKLDKYNMMADLEKEYKCKINFRVVALDMATGQITTSDDELIPDVDLHDIMTVFKKVESMSNFPLVKAFLDKSEVLEDAAKFNMEVDTLNKMILGTVSLPDKAPEMVFSVDKDAIGKEEDLYFKTSKLLLDDEFLRLIRTSRTVMLNQSSLEITYYQRYSSCNFDKTLKAPEFGPDMTRILSTANVEVREMINSGIKSLEATRNNLNIKIPKLFKMVLIPMGSEAGFAPTNWRRVNDLSDGTTLYSHRNEWRDMIGSDTSRAGIGSSIEDTKYIDTVINDIVSFPDMVFNTWVEAFESTDLFVYLGNMEETVREIMLLSERRFAFKRNKSFTAFKRYKKFAIAVHSGTKAMKEKQLNVKVFIECNNTEEVERVSKMGRTFKSPTNDEMFETDWFTVSMQDFNHYLTIRDRACILLENLDNKFRETSNDSVRVMTQSPKIAIMPILYMMEHKRGTSTQNQLSRYLVNGFTSYICDKKKLVAEIFSEPVRSVLQSYSIRAQCEWVVRMVEDSRYSMFQKIRIHSNESDYDKLFLPSFSDTRIEIEFSVMMDEIYYCNLFDANSGFKAHRENAIMSKMEEMEEKYNKLVSEDITRMSLSFDEIAFQEEKFCQYSSDYVRRAAKKWSSRPNSKAEVAEALAFALDTTLSEVVKMTKSLLSADTKVPNFIRYSSVKEKRTVFECVMSEFDSYSVTDLLTMVSKDEELFAMFDSFAKGQIGKAREILVQAIRTRFATALFNSFFKKLCEFHEKEMITKEHQKKEIMANTSANFRKEASISSSFTSKDIKVFATINADSAKWAPSMVMTQFMEMLDEMPIEDEFKLFMMNLLRSYMMKGIFAPKSFVQKATAAEDEEDIMKMKVRLRMNQATGLIFYHSGMGQGNLQHPSSFWHCIVDDLGDEIMCNVLKSMGVREVQIVTLISSDDFCKMMLIVVSKELVSSLLPISLAAICDMLTTCRLAANIHINWKKTAFQFFVIEFNSIFATGKRVSVATVKDIYNCTNIPDMTYPERAVKEVLAAIRPLLTGGCYLAVIELSMSIMRENLIKWYAYTPERIMDIMTVLDIREETLIPFHLGFVPVEFPIETLLFGLNLHCFNTQGNETLKKFYRNLHSANTMGLTEAIMESEIEEEITGKYYMQLPTRMDKRVNEMKEKFFNTSDREVMLKTINTFYLNNTSGSHRRSDFIVDMSKYILGISKRYEFSESFRFNSMIRALSITSENIMIKPDSTMKEDKSAFWSGSSAMKDNLVTSVRFVEVILDLNPVNSMMDYMTSYEKLYLEAVQVQNNLKVMFKSMVARHAKSRTFRFVAGNMFDTVKPREVIEALMSGKMILKSRIITILHRIAAALMVTYEDLLSSPLTVIKKAFSGKDRNLLDFKSFLDAFCSITESAKVDMVMEFAPEAKRFDNIQNVYRFKLDPTCVYTSNVIEKNSMVMKKFLTLMSIKSLNEAAILMKMPPDTIHEEDATLEISDNSLVMGMKMVARLKGRSEIMLTTRDSTPILVTNGNKKTELISALTDLQVVVRFMKSSHNVVRIIFSAHNVESKLSVFMRNYVRNECIYLSTKNTDTLFRTDISSRSMVDLSLRDLLRKMTRKDLYYRRVSRMASMRVKASFSRWTLMLEWASVSWQVASAAYSVDTAFVDDDIDDIIELRRNEKTLKEINEMFIKLGMDKCIIPKRRLAASEADFDNALAMQQAFQSMIKTAATTQMRADPVATAENNFFVDANALSAIMGLRGEVEIAEYTEEEYVEVSERMIIRDIIHLATVCAVKREIVADLPTMMTTCAMSSDTVMSIIATYFKKELNLCDTFTLVVCGVLFRDNILKMTAPAIEKVKDISDMATYAAAIPTIEKFVHITKPERALEELIADIEAEDH